MKTSRMAVIGLAATVAYLLAPSMARAADQAAIDKSVERAVEYLKKVRAGNHWEYHIQSKEYSVGLTALCTLSLLEAGVPRTDPIVASGARYVRDQISALNGPHATATYPLALSIILLDKMYPDAGGTIRNLSIRLAAAQNQKTGAWSYECPPLDAKGKTEEWGKFLADHQDKGLPDNAPENLLGTGGFCDNSNTQFAILALWVGRRHGAKVNHPLFLAERRFRKTQEPSGGWSYGLEAGGGNHPTPSMTAAGLLALALGFSSSRESGVTIVRSGSGKLDVGSGPDSKGGSAPQESLDTDAQVMKAQQFLANYMKAETLGNIEHSYYFLWSLERVCVTYGWDKQINGIDWYAWGSKILLSAQAQDGSWPGDTHSGTVADTCFAILFLKKADLVPDARDAMKRTVVRAEGPSAKKGTKDSKNVAAGPGAQKDEKPAGKDLTAEQEEALKEEQRITAEANRLRDIVVGGAGIRQEEALKKLRDTQGKQFTMAMVEAIKKIGGGGLQVQVRDALAERLQRQNPNGLRFYLSSNEPELKAAAAWAAALKPCKEVFPDIIPLIGDTDEMVASKALEALKILSGGQDHGKSVDKWKDWWSKNNKAPSTK